MGIVQKSVIVVSALPAAFATGDGVCLPAGAAWANYFRAGKVSWFKDLTLTAVDISIRGNAIPTTSAQLSNAFYDAFVLTDGVLAFGGYHDPYIDDASTNAGCLSCLLGYISTVVIMLTDKSFPVECQNKDDFDIYIDLCIYALSGAAADFADCTGATANDLASPYVTDLSGGRCTAQQIVHLDGEFNLFASLLNRVLFSVLDVDFDNALLALPCSSVLIDWLTGFTDPVKGLLRLNTACGLTANNAFLMTSDCVNTQIGATSADTLAAYFHTLRDQLGGGFDIRIGEDASTRCTAEERRILSHVGSYEALLRCTWEEGDPSMNSVAWEACVNTYWPMLGLSLMDVSQSYSCASCFVGSSGVASALNSRKYSAYITLDACEISGALVPFNEFCLAQVASAGTFDILYQCSGVSFSATSRICSPADINQFSRKTLSLLPFVELVNRVMKDESLTTNVGKLSAAIERLSSQSWFMIDATTPCYYCFGGLTSDILVSFLSNFRFSRNCSPADQVSCLGSAFFTNILARFEACSGISLSRATSITSTSAPYETSSTMTTFDVTSATTSTTYPNTKTVCVIEVALLSVLITIGTLIL